MKLIPGRTTFIPGFCVFTLQDNRIGVSAAINQAGYTESTAVTRNSSLRSDVHILFDRGYLGVDTRHRLLVSPRLRAEFGNGDQFYARAGESIALPDRRPDR